MKSDVAYSGAANAPIEAQVIPTTAVTNQPMAPMAVYTDFNQYQPLPADMIRCDPLCCAFRCTNCENGCFGCSNLLKCCCIEKEFYCWKPIENNPRACCLWGLVSLEIVEMFYSCRWIHQMCCFELICGCPLDQSYVHGQIDYGNYGKVNEKDVYPCNSGCFCCAGSIIESCYCKYPQCLGGYSNGTCCCYYASSACCKPLCYDDSYPKNSCILYRNRVMCVEASGCCKEEAQCCCYDRRLALPCDTDVPCMCMMLPFPGLTCCVNWRCVCKCCLNLAEIQEINMNVQNINYQNKV